MITIIGAGISGLYTGLLCKRNQIPFEILEKTDYTGGRIYTKYTSYNSPVELGAEEVHLWVCLDQQIQRGGLATASKGLDALHLRGRAR